MECLPVLALVLILNVVEIKGQCTFPDSVTTNNYMWWKKRESSTNLAFYITNTETCSKYVTSVERNPSDYATQGECETCVSSTTGSNNRITYVGELPAVDDSSKRLIYCNDMFISTNAQAAIYRQAFRNQGDPGSVAATDCNNGPLESLWVVRTQPGDFSLKQSTNCPFTTGNYIVTYGYNGNNRCTGGTNNIATVFISGSNLIFKGGDCTDYKNDRTANGFSSTDTTKDYTLPLTSTLTCITGSEFPGSVLGNNIAGNYLLLADTNPPSSAGLRGPWYYSCTYKIPSSNQIQLSCFTGNPNEILIDPAQAPTRLNSNLQTKILYFVLARQEITAGCNFPSQFEADEWFLKYAGGGDILEIEYEDLVSSAVNRRIYRSPSDTPRISEEICTVSVTSSTVGSGSYDFYAMGEVPGEYTCYAYLRPINTILNKVLVRYETQKSIFPFVDTNTCRNYMTNYNEAEDQNKKVVLRVLPKLFVSKIANGISGADSYFGDWSSYTCPFTNQGAYQTVYSESSTVFNQCEGNKKSTILINGNGLTISTCAPASDNTYQKPYHAVMTCIGNWESTRSPHLPLGQGSATDATTDHYVVLALKNLNIPGGTYQFICARYREDGDKIYMALNVFNPEETLCRTDKNAQAYEDVTTGKIRQFTLTKQNICDSAPCLNDGTCAANGETDLTCTCHKSYSGDRCQFRAESFSEKDISTTITVIIVVCVVGTAIVILMVLFREWKAREDEKKRMDSENGNVPAHKTDNISTISGDPKSNVSLNGSNVQAWFPDYRQTEK